MVALSRSQKPKQGKWTILGVLFVANLMVFGTLFYLQTLHTAIVDEVTVDPNVAGALSAVPDSGEPVTFLVIGSDSRAGLPADWIGDFGNAGGQRADVMMLVQILPEQHRVQMLSLPRDLQVNIPGRGKEKVNAAYSFGGAELAIETVTLAFDVPIHHYVEVDFVGFAAIVDEMGGLEIPFAYAARDLKSGLSVEAGIEHMDGRSALAYARSRSFQELHDGEWVFVDANDIGRTRRQQEIMVAIFKGLKSPSLLVDAPGIITAMARHMVVSPAFREIDFGDLLVDFRKFELIDIDAATLPTEGKRLDGRDFQVAGSDAELVLEAFRQGTSMELVADGPVTIRVLNGSGVAGIAGAWAEWFEARGFDVVDVGNADRSDFLVTQVISRPSAIGTASHVIEILGFGEIATGTLGANMQVSVIIGQDAKLPPETENEDEN